MGAQAMILGIGTGRSGSLSLARLLNLQAGVFASHEFREIQDGRQGKRLAEPLPWTSSLEIAEERLGLILDYPGDIVGDVSSSWLPYLAALFEEGPSNLRVVCLRRAREAVVESFMRKTGKKHHWADHDGRRWLKDPRWDATFPNLDPSLTKREAISRYWDEYRAEVDRLCRTHPERIRVWDMVEALGAGEQTRQMLEFAGVPPQDQVLSSIKANVAPAWWVSPDATPWRRTWGRAARMSIGLMRRLGPSRSAKGGRP
ncbi:MAG: hypothetical protein ACRDXD_11480 [Acidimicrobiia bacterium]